jgi:Putative sensor
MTAVTAGRAESRGTAEYRVSFHRNPLRLAFSVSPWRSGGYLISYLAVSWVLFSLAFSAAVTAAALGFTLIAFPLLVSAASVVHWCAGAERRLLGQVFDRPVQARYRPATGSGPLARASASWRDRATWGELAYLTGLWLPLYALDTIVISIWATFLAGVTLPLWYWAPWNEFGNGQRVHGVQLGYFPNGPHGPGGHGLYIDTLPRALFAAAGFAILFLLFNYVLVATARMQGRVARAMLRPPADPLAEARAVLTEPGPLSSIAATAPPAPPSRTSG